MGKIKAEKMKKSKSKDYQLTEFEAAFLKALVVGRNAAYNQYQEAIQAYLSNLGVEKIGISSPENYEFSADLEAGTVSIKVR
jgi:hypothetical protein